MSSPRSRPQRRSARARIALAAGLAAVAVLAFGLVAGSLLVSAAAGAGVAVLAAGALRAQGPHPAVGGREVWRWSWRGAVGLAVGLGVEAWLIGHDGPVGVGLTTGATLLSAMAYQGLVHWNRHRTATSDPGDWLNGLGATLCATALGMLVLAQIPSAAQLPVEVLAGHMVRLSAATVLLGTCATIIVIAGLRRDRRSRLVVLTVATVVVAELLDLVRLIVSGAAQAGGPALSITAWSLLALALAVASTMGELPRTAGYASSQATTRGAVVVIGAGVGILTTDALVRGGSPVVALLAAAGAAAAGLRVLRLMHDLSALASSRIEARTDSLTGVANRRALIEAVDTFSSRAQGAALLVIDLDRFKEINDRYGHQVGDEVIRAMAGRLRDVLPDDAVLARLGGDEFAVVLADPEPSRATAIADRVCVTIAEPIDVDGRVIRVAASVGVASTVLGEHPDGELLRCADAAMYVAKRAGGGVQVYDHETNARGRDRHELAAELRAMLEHGREDLGRLVLHYQPQIEARSGAVTAVEALVRWDHPQRGLLPPADFLDLAEEHGLMTPLTWAVLDQSTRQAARWRAQGQDLRVAVNLSTSCLEYPGLLDALRDALRRAQLPAGSLVVEITETSLMQDPELAIDVARQISALGLAVSIDDYGTGYSSLAYLDRLPADELKLDRSFTSKLAGDDRTRAIVSGTIELAHSLGLRVVAEGVEDARTLAFLVDLGCDLTQGYLHARPSPATELVVWLDERRAVSVD